jgi:hypothetical protein
VCVCVCVCLCGVCNNSALVNGMDIPEFGGGNIECTAVMRLNSLSEIG